MRITVFSAALLLANAVTAAPFTPSTPLTHVRYAATGISARAAVASNGHGFVAVWQTDRDQRVAHIGEGESNVGVPIEQWGWSAPSIAAAGDRYVVAATHQHDLEAIFVDDAAHPAGDPIPVETGAFAPAIAVSGDRIGIVYTHSTKSGIGLEMVLLSRDGIILERNIILPTTLLFSGLSRYAISANASGFAVAVVSASGVNVVTLDKAGTVVATTSLEGLGTGSTSDQPVQYVSIASDGHAYMVLWTASDGTLRATSLGADGVVLGSGTVARTTQKPATARIGQPSIAFDGRQYVCGYIDGDSPTSRLDVSGNAYVTRIDSSPFAISNSQPVQTENRVFGVATAAANGSSVVMWADLPSGGYAGNAGSGYLHAAAVGDAWIGTPFPVAIAAGGQLNPAAASNGAETLVTWIDQPSATISAGLLDGSGHWRELGPITWPYPVVLASNGTDFLIVWYGGAARLASDGTRLDTTSLATSLSVEPTSAIWDGHRYVIAGNMTSGTGAGVFTVDPSGAVGPLHVLPVPQNGGQIYDPMLAWSGSAFLMSFRRLEGYCVSCFQKEAGHVLLLTPTFEPGSEVPISEPGFGYPLSTAVAWNGSEFLAVATNGALTITRISPDGKSLGSVPVNLPEAGSLGRPSIVVDGTDFVVAARIDETDYVRSPTGDYVHHERSPVNSYLVAVHTDGSASDVKVIETAATTGDLVLINAAGREVLVSSQAVEAAPYYGASRVTIQTTAAATIGPAPKLSSVFAASVATLQWTPVANATEYRVEYRNGSGDEWRELDLSQGLTTSLSVHMNSTTTKFEFRVRGWSGAGVSPYSNAIPLVLPRRRAS